MSCLVPPAKRVWRVLRARLGLRRTTTGAGAGAGLGRLRKEVRACDYSDVHVMWDMLSRPSSSTGDRRGGPGRGGMPPPSLGAGWRSTAAGSDHLVWSEQSRGDRSCSLFRFRSFSQSQLPSRGRLSYWPLP